MIRLFKYIEQVWLGDDGKPSVKRIFAIAFSIHIMYSISTYLTSYVRLVHAVYTHDKSITSDMITAAGASLSNLAMLVGIEAGLVAALLGLASYQSVQIQRQQGITGPPDPPANPPANFDDTVK